MPTRKNIRAKQEHPARSPRAAKRPTSASPAQGEAAGYERHKEQARQRQASQSAAGREIGPLPAPRHPRRKARAKTHFGYFAKTYFPEWFYLPFSRDHDAAIAKIERAVKKGELFALAMPRGSGKSALMMAAVLWAVLYGWVSLVMLIAANQRMARDLLRKIQAMLETNELLGEDFPEAVYPIRKLARVYNRKAGQTLDGQPTRIDWTKDLVVLPTVPGAASSGAMLAAAGIESGNLRGVSYAHPDGSIRRPGLVFLDDPQTRRSASSALQSERRAEILAGDILFMGGPDKRIAGLCACTVIRSGDMADRILEVQQHPEWHGERTQMVRVMPSRMDLWDEYGAARAAEQRDGGDGTLATKFYRRQRKAMDAGAEVSWPARHDDGELSGLQHAMNLYYRDRAAFFAECQNEPIEERRGAAGRLKADQVAARTNGRDRGQVPARCTVLTSYVDVHDRLLYWGVSGWEPNLTGYQIDYGTYPEQADRYFALDTCRKTLPEIHPGGTKSGPIYAGLVALVQNLLTRRFPREDGALCSIDLCLINSGYLPDAVGRAIRTLARGPQLLPSIGVGIGPARKPLTEYKPEPGVVYGRHWRKAKTRSTQLLTIEIDVGRWKSTMRDCLVAAVGEGGAYTLFGKDSQRHKLWADHLAAQSPAEVEGRWGKQEVWTLVPGEEDHWLDCTVGQFTAANVLGCGLPEWAAIGRRRDPSSRPTAAQLAGKG
jgi:energy-coupling factor transporter ATP-binding protein EcfA2